MKNHIKKCVGLIIAVILLGLSNRSIDIVKAQSSKQLSFDNSWVRGEDFDDTGSNEYKFVIPSSGLVTLNIIRYQQMFTDIYDEDYNLLFSISNEGATKSSPSSVKREEYFDAGVYYLKITSANGNSATDAYDIKTSFTTSNNFDKEPNTAYAQANAISAGKNYICVIAVGDEADWYKIWVKKGYYTLHMTTYGSI